MPDAHQKLFDAGMSLLEGHPPDREQADQCFLQILAKDPTHFLANFGHLFVLHSAKVTARTRAECLRHAKLVLEHAPKQPRGVYPEFALRFAANTLAWDLYRRHESDDELRQALAYAEAGVRGDRDYDDIHSPITATKYEILIALGREDEAYALVQKVLEAKPSYKHLLGVPKTAGFKRWLKARGGQDAKDSPFAALIGDELATERNLAMLATIDALNENERHVPMARAAIERLRMQRERGRRKATVPLPPSLKALLAYDSRLRIRGRAMFECLEKTLLTSTTMTEIFRASRIAPAYEDLKKSDEADMPALIELPLGSDQRVFVYVATPDADGEYPILRWDDEPCIWISSGCLQDEIGSLSDVAATKRKERAEKAVAKWLKREPEPRFYENDDDDD